MSSLEMILILALFLNFSSDSHSLQEESTPTSLNAIQHLHEPMTFSHYPLDTENGTESSPPEAPVLSSIEEFCSAKMMDSIGLVYHVGSHLLLSVTQEPNASMVVSGNQTNDTVKQWFYVYNWKTGGLYHKMVQLDEIFVMPDFLKPHGPLVFATTICMSVQPCDQAAQLVLATFSTSETSMESIACHDLTYLNHSQTPNQFLSTRMFRLTNPTEGLAVPKLSLYPSNHVQVQLRGRIGFGGGILIREELACPRVGFSRNSTNSTVQYASGFTLPDRLILQARPGFVQFGPNGKEMPISRMLNCPSALEPNISLVFPNELKLDTTESSGFLIIRGLRAFFLRHPFISTLMIGLPLGICFLRFFIPIYEEILDDYTDDYYKPTPEEQPEQIQYV